MLIGKNSTLVSFHLMTLFIPIMLHRLPFGYMEHSSSTHRHIIKFLANKSVCFLLMHSQKGTISVKLLKRFLIMIQNIFLWKNFMFLAGQENYGNKNGKKLLQCYMKRS